jgi:hypothetical protein
MRLSLTKLENIALTIITILRMLSVLCLLVRPETYIVTVCDFYFFEVHRETDRFFAVSGVQFAQPDRGQFHYHRTVFSSQLKSKCGNILSKAATPRIMLSIDGAPVMSRSHTHPSHSQNSRL